MIKTCNFFGDSMVFVSIIIPIFNSEKYLTRCLNSLINQSLKEIEIICINDGSTDKSLSILEDFAKKDERIVILNQENKGQSIARNEGINIAKGEYIGFVDSDDWVDLDFFEKLYKSAKSNNCDIASAGIIRLHKFNKKYYLKYNKEIITENTNEKFEICDVPELSYIWNKIYKLSEFRKNNFSFTPGIYYEDVIITPKLLFFMKKLIVVPDTYYYYWRHKGSSVTLRTEKANKDSILAHEQAFNFIKGNNIDISSHEPKTKRYKFFGLSIFKIRTKGNKIQYILFNVLKFTKYKK